jgi:hypothetical protein
MPALAMLLLLLLLFLLLYLPLFLLLPLLLILFLPPLRQLTFPAQLCVGPASTSERHPYQHAPTV